MELLSSGIRFAKHVVGVEELDDPSRRCEGGCEQLASEAAIVKQAEALAVGQLRKFHDLLYREGADAWDSAFSAYCLVCAYGRCRQSDMSWVERVECAKHTSHFHVHGETSLSWNHMS